MQMENELLDPLRKTFLFKYQYELLLNYRIFPHSVLP